MRGPSRYLGRDEELVLTVRRHGAVLIAPAAITAVVIVAAAAIGLAADPADGAGLLDVLAGLVACAFAARFGWRLLEWWVARVVVTDQRVLEVSGVLTRKVASMPLGKVTDMTYRRSVMGRLLGYGDLVLETPGQDQALYSIDHLPHPDDFYRTVTSLCAASADAPPVQVPPPGRDEEDTGPLPIVTI